MTVRIYSGLPGSGKTTLGKAECDQVFEADQFFVNDRTGLYTFDPSKLSEAHAWCFRRFLTELMADDNSVVGVTNTNVSAWEISPYYQGALAFGREVKIIRVNCDPTVEFPQKYCAHTLRIER